MLDRTSLPVPIDGDLDPAAGVQLTCGSCRNSPATHLVVAYLRVRMMPQVQQLSCKPCADLDLKHVQTGDHLYLFRLVPEEVRECRHCHCPIRRCTSTCATATDYPLCHGWRHVGYDNQPVIGHCCGGRSINPAAEPREEASPDGL